MPQKIEGIDIIEYQIIDDGSTDRTIEVAKELGINHIVQIHGKNRRWLGRAFKLGIDSALKNGADIIVNTDGDNQYPSAMIPELIQPILEGRCDLAIGNRHPEQFHEFSNFKRFLQKFGNLIISQTVGEHVPDAVSGFRAYSRNAAMQIHIVTNYTYTIDSLIQSYKKGIDIEWIDIIPNPKTRESRLIKNLFSKVIKSAATIIRLGITYNPIKIFMCTSLIFILPGLFLILRFLYFYLFDPSEEAGHVQSVVIGGISLVIGCQIIFLGILAELSRVNRQLLENNLTRIKRLESSK